MSFANDTFTEASDTTLASHTPDSGGTWTSKGGATSLTVSATSDILVAASTSGFNAYYHSVDPATADYEVQADFYAGSSANVTPGIAGRISTSADTMYYAYYQGSSGWALYKRVAATNTQLGSFYTGSLPTTQRTVKLKMVGSAIEVFIDSVSQISATDSAITAKGKAGVFGYYADTGTSRYIDTWSATDLGGTSTWLNKGFWWNRSYGNYAGGQ